MSDLTAFEGRKLEKLLGMGSGYVLNFTDRTYSEFFIDYRVDIDAAQYRTGGDSKAKRPSGVLAHAAAAFSSLASRRWPSSSGT